MAKFKKSLGAFLTLTMITAGFFAIQNRADAFLWFKKEAKEKTVDKISFAPVNNIGKNKVWVGTFQLVWNDLKNDIIKAPVEFKDGKSDLAKNLNKEGFTVNDISDDSYYKNKGVMTPDFKKEIEDDIKEKFSETSDILDTLDWNSKSYLIYAMLKKDFEYLKEFPELNGAPFNNSKENVKYFGIKTEDSIHELKDNLGVLFYNSSDDYAVKLITKGNDEVILYRTNDNKTLEKYVIDVDKKAKNYKEDTTFKRNDRLKVPYIKIDEMFNYNELCNREIKGSDFIITGAIQTLKFNLDNKGGSLKSEAALIMKMNLVPVEEIRNFDFSKPFVLILKEKDKEIPYFIADIKNDALLKKAE